ncbi:24179_t:CDS:2, partial [Gigaspora rosea]
KLTYKEKEAEDINRVFVRTYQYENDVRNKNCVDINIKNLLEKYDQAILEHKKNLNGLMKIIYEPILDLSIEFDLDKH